jgi:hypothetical protein
VVTADRRHLLLVDRGRRRRPHALYGLAAEIRAVESGHNARVLPDGSILVKSDSQPRSHRVWIRGISDDTVMLGCTCRSGTHRTYLPVPCKHAALAGRRLEREGLARWHDGAWRIGPHAQVRGLRMLLARTVGRESRWGRPRGRPRPARDLDRHNSWWRSASAG